MLRLICFELRKHFLKPSIAAALLLLTILNVLKIQSIYTENSLFSRGRSVEETSMIRDLYRKMNLQFGGEITLPKINRLMDIYLPLQAQTSDLTATTATDVPGTYTGNIYNDYHFFKRFFVSPMEYEYQYQSFAKQVAASAAKNAAFYSQHGSRYFQLANERLSALFHDRSIPDYLFPEMYQYYFSYDFSVLLILLLCLYAFSGVFVLEKETAMEPLLITFRYGGFRTAAAKLLASVFFMLAVCLWFWLCDYFAFCSFFGCFQGTSSPLYAIQSFSCTPFTFSIGHYTLLAASVKTIGILITSLCFLLLSSLFKTALLPFLTGLATAFALFYLQQRFLFSSQALFRIWNPFHLAANQDLFIKTEFINCFGYPVLLPAASGAAAAIMALLLLVLVFVIQRKNSVLASPFRCLKNKKGVPLC